MMSKLYLATKNTNMQIIFKLCPSILMGLMTKSEYLILPKGAKFGWSGKLELKTRIGQLIFEYMKSVSKRDWTQ